MSKEKGKGAAKQLTRKQPLKRAEPLRKAKASTKPKAPKVSKVDDPDVRYQPKGGLAPNKPIRFIDLFCGIGGFRLAFERNGGECVFSSDWDKYSQKTYAANYGEVPNGDITRVEVADIPQHDVLCAGFPCQPFSIAGVSKKNSLGRKHGFEDERQGNLFFNIAAILDHHRPAAFVLENVKNLKGHDKGRTFKTIHQILTGDLKYHVSYGIIDAQAWLPQHRERIFIVGFRDPRHFAWPKPPKNGPKLGDILDPKVAEKYTLTDHLWAYLQNYAAKHKAAGNGFGFGLVGPNDISRTLSARYHKDGSEILIDQGKGINPRRLTPRECARLMGYPESFKIDQVSDTQAYRQFGNSVAVPVVQAVAESVVAALNEPVLEAPPLVMQLGEPIVLHVNTDSKPTPVIPYKKPKKTRKTSGAA
jgi:DNA (cytosine-5)-methyltransferase 1